MASTVSAHDPRTTTDGVIALALLAFVVGLVLHRNIAITPLPVALGAISTIGVEYLLARRYDTVRSIWSRRVVRVAAVGAAILLVLASAAVRLDAVVGFVLASLVAYLTLLVAVRFGVVRNPRRW